LVLVRTSSIACATLTSLAEVAADRLADQARRRRRRPRLRTQLARWLYALAALLSASVADAGASGTLVRTMIRRNGVEYWRPASRTPRHAMARAARH